MKEFFVSDLHFFHANALRFDKRPWETVEEMNEALVRNWNERVTNADRVFILGDITWSRDDTLNVPLFKSLKGHKYLVMGNHDYKNLTPALRECFEEVWEGYHKYKSDVSGKTMILSHYPIPFFDGYYGNNVHLFGHIHNSEPDNFFLKEWMKEYRATTERKCEMYNVGVMAPYMEWGPKTLDEIREANPEIANLPMGDRSKQIGIEVIDKLK